MNGTSGVFSSSKLFHLTDFSLNYVWILSSPLGICFVDCVKLAHPYADQDKYHAGVVIHTPAYLLPLLAHIFNMCRCTWFLQVCFGMRPGGF